MGKVIIMALTLLVNGLDIDVGRSVATGRFDYTTEDDLPVRGAAAPWVDGSADWYVAEIRKQPRWHGSANNHTVQLTARVPGLDWTWLGLAPITEDGTYDLEWRYFIRYDLWDVSTSQPTRGVQVAHLRHLLSSWGNSHDLIVSDGADVKVDVAGSPGSSATNGYQSQAVINNGLATWKVEWLEHQRWSVYLHKANGSWLENFNPPVTGNGKYFCRDLRMVAERHKTDAGIATYYRHFAEFLLAPSVDGTQHTWRFAQWV